MRAPLDTSARLYALLLLFFPRATRERDGADMVRLFEAQLARRRGRARLRLWLRAIVDAARHGTAERLEARARTGVRRPRGRGFASRGVDMLTHDIRDAVRLLSRQPGLASLIVLALALGIGANTAVFSVVHAVLLRPLPYHEPDRLVLVWEKRAAEGVFNNHVSPADFVDWQRLATSFSALAAYSADTADLTGAGEPVQLARGRVTARFFDVLGVRPLHGRTFAAHDDREGQHRVAVIGHALWQQRFGADSGAIGRRVDLNGVPHEIVGVLSRNFDFPGDAIDLWTPLPLETGGTPLSRAAHFLSVYARLVPGASVDSARAEMDRIGRDLEAAYPSLSRGHGAHVAALRDEVLAPARAGLLVTMAAVTFLLLIACTNVANLLMARGIGQRREMAIRSAIGATRGRLFQQTITESVVLSALGGCGGLIVAWWSVQLLVAETPPALRGVGMDRAQLNVPVLLFTTAVCIVTALITGALPAWQVAREEPADPLRESGRSPFSLKRGLRFALIATEVALTVLLLVGAGLMLRSFIGVLSQPPGIELSNRITVHLVLPVLRYPDAEAVRRARRELDERFIRIPGVLAVGATSHLPLSGVDSRGGITVVGLQRVPGDAPVRAHPRYVTPGYFAAAGIVLRRGRGFTDADNATAPPVVVINDTMARRYWPGGDPIGRRMRFNGEGDPWREVVGVVGDVKHWGLDRDVNPEAYMPHDQVPSARLTYVLHAPGDQARVASGVTGSVKAMDPYLPVAAIRPMEEVASRSLAARRWSVVLLGLFALLGVALAGAGIYGVLAHLVSMRTSEIGIRMTLGAHPRRVLGEVLGEALLHAGAGLIVGLGAAALATRLVATMLFDVRPLDPITFVGASVVVLLIALLAAAVPARRAMRIDPVSALRAE